MRRFDQMEVEQAVAFAMAGGQALHLHRIIVDYRNLAESPHPLGMG